MSLRLGQLDAVKRGWILHGFPQTRNQVDSLSQMGYEPNRVIVLDLSSDTAVERLSLRAVDPVTGERYGLWTEILQITYYVVNPANELVS